MNMNTILLNIAKFFEKKKRPIFNYSVKKQMQYLKKIGKANNDIQRSFLQYKCQKKMNGFFYNIVFNICSIPLIFYYIIKYYDKREKLNADIFKCDSVFFREGKPCNILPDSLKNEFNKIEYNPQDNMKLQKKDLRFIFEIIKKHPFSYLFILKSIIKIAKYRYAIDVYNPRAIIVCSEFSFTSSLLTQFCHKNNIIHINVMHGEKLFFIRDSYFHFDRCYIWDKYYSDLFISLNAENNQFIIEVPESLKIKQKENANKIYDYTYYLGGESHKELENISKNLEILNKKYKISVRPHPRYSKLDEISEIFKYADIEDCSKCLIEESIYQTKNAISLYSTVLNQASNSKVNIVIDNLSNPDLYNKLLDLKYICLNKKHDLLSEIVNNI